ncbi:MAG: tRNA pseudouridine(38-40) synthase TruA [Chitinophagaceae bacterium]|nr:tRNA pseudouridine(38-40) synthase TruA [Chitinophagaceae bacterium]
MSRYFIEISYRGEGYAGFQVQQNAVTIQSEVEKALGVLFRTKITLTGSSRTDTDVHAEQNYFHFDIDREIGERMIYNINSLLPGGIAVKSMRKVKQESHCRFDALWRQYRYVVYAKKDPFLEGRGYYFPYTLDLGEMKKAAAAVMEYEDFSSFAKRNSQVKNYKCRVLYSDWEKVGGCWVYRVRANRFLRGMVRGMTGTMLKVGRGKLSVDDFRRIIGEGNSSLVDFSVPGRGLYLEKVEFGEGYFR